MNDNQKKLADLIKNSKRIVALTGAGISTESGIPDFRSSNGVWTQNLSRERIMSTSFLEGNPKQFWPAYKEIFQIKLSGDFEPNDGHRFLVDLEQAGKEVTIATQNVDGLHTKAGSSKVYEIHGTMRKAHCPKCKTEYTLEYIRDHDIPRCRRVKSYNSDMSVDYCNFILHPNVVLFGGQIFYFKEASYDVEDADLILVLGSSLQVGPFNMLPQFATKGSTRVIINRDPTEMDFLFDLVIHDGIGDTFRAIREYVL